MAQMMSISTKITGTVLLLVVGLGTLLMLVGYHYFALNYREQLAREHTSTLRMVAEHVDGELRRSKANLAIIAGSLAKKGIRDPSLIQRKLDEERPESSQFFDAGFMVIDAAGRTVAQLPRRPSTLPLPPELQALVRSTLAGGPVAISTPFRAGADRSRQTVALAGPIRGAGGDVTAVLVGLHDLRHNGGLTDVGNIGSESKGFIFLVDRGHTILMHPNATRLMQQLEPGRLPAVDRALAAGGLFASEGNNYRGVGGAVIACSLTEVPWVVGGFYPYPEQHAPLQRARGFFAIGSLVILLPGVVILWLLIRRATLPLLWLAKHVRELPEKEGDERLVTLHTGDELETLAGAFNAMVAGMDQKHQIQRDNQELYRILSELTLEFAFWADDSAIRFISANCRALTGYSDKEFYADPTLLDRLIHPADQERWVTHLRNRWEESCDHLDVRLITKWGEVRWFNHTCHEIPHCDSSRAMTRGGSFRDITQRVILEQKLERQREFAQSLLENTSTPLFVIDAEHRVIIWNRALTELTGFAPETMLGTRLHWRPFYPEERPTLADLVLDDKISEIANYYGNYSERPVLPGIMRAEGWYQRLNGKRRYLVFDAAQVRRQGETVAVVETLYDITERATAEESLRLFSEAVEQTGSSVIITDPAGVIQYVNRKFCEVTGYSADEAVGSSPRFLRSGQTPPEVYRELWDTVSKGATWHGEFRNRHKNGELFWESATISPIVNTQGAITHYLGVKEDITQRKESERKLAKKQAELVLKHEQLSNLFGQVELAKKEWEQTMDCIDDLVLMADSDNRVRRFNRAFVEFTGRAYQELLASRDWREPLQAAGLDAALIDGSSTEIFHEPSRRWFTVRTYPYGERGGSVITLHDLTEIKTVSEQLAKAYDELKNTHSQLLQQEKMASIGQLAAGVAHEINNPMGFISSNLASMEKYLDRIGSFLALQDGVVADCAAMGVREALAGERKKLRVDFILEDARSLLAESREGAERVRTIVQNLKTFSRVDEAQSSWVDLNECLESTINIAWNELKYKCTLVRDFGELPRVKCLPQQLNQVFLNMLVNAAHAIEERGEIGVGTRRDGDSVVVTISDTGSGIPEEIRHRIFEPFFTTKKVGQGTGLGLSISYDIIKKHGGSIEVVSAPGEGTTFTIILPIEGVEG